MEVYFGPQFESYIHKHEFEYVGWENYTEIWSCKKCGLEDNKYVECL